MSELTLEISAEFIEGGFKTGNIIQHTVISKGLPIDAKLTYAGRNVFGDLELRFESKKDVGQDRNINIEVITTTDA